MDNRKRGGSLLSFYGRLKEEDRRNDGGVGVQKGGEVERMDLLEDEDDEIFSMISEDSIRIEETKEQEQPQPSTSYQVGSPSGPALQARPLEKLPDFDEESGTSWIYPVNYPLRGYQYSIVENSLYQNTLVSLPTGLGKTFIAAVVMYNFYRWYPTCKVVFMAPTKPLVAQQIEACFNIMGIPQEDISQMTGTLNPEKRIEQWMEKRVFFLTPQVITNDLSRGTCPAKLIKCLVLDEAHRALGNHAYCQVVRGLKEHGHDFRIVALSATPGSDVMAVKQVLNNLFISHVELRSEDSPDIQEYTYQRNIEKVVVPLGEELNCLKTRYLKVLRVYVNRLLELNVLHTRDETTLTKFQILKSRDCFRQNPPDNLPRSKFGSIEGLFALCMTLYHSYELMMQHGIRSFYRFLKDTINGEKGHYFARGELRNNALFQTIMRDLSEKFETDFCVPHSSKQDNSALFSLVGSPQGPKVNPEKPFIISHPKMAKLLSIVLEHHQKFAKEGKSTRIMIFSQYRESVMEITEMLQQHYPTVRAMSFIGHGSAGQSGKGLSQKKQLQVVSKFREGGYNTLVSTCVGEEGLDIGDVDLIICYDAPKSPIRLVQRMGRTGRQREGRIVVLVTAGKEEQSYNASQYQKRAINNALANTSKLARYLVPNSPRMVPRGLSPTCLKLHMKVDVWKTNTKGCKSPKGKGSILSMLSKAGSKSSKNTSAAALLSPEDWHWYRNNRVPQREIKTLPPPSLMCVDASKNKFDPERHINLGSYQPWQSLAQATHLVGHSPHTLHLVELTEFIHLQQHIGPDEDPYGLEMAAFLDKAYVEDNEENYQLSPDFKKAPARHRPAASPGDRKEKKGKRKQTAVSDKRKKPKCIQSSLITDMFNRMTQSQAKDRENNHQKGMDNARQEAKESSQYCVKNSVINTSMTHLRGNCVDLPDNGDDDVICLVDDNVDLIKSTPGSVHDSENDGQKHSVRLTEPSKMNRRDQNYTKNIRDEKQDSSEEHLFLPMPTGSVSLVDIQMPPQTNDDDDEEIEEPDSPSEVLVFCNNWVTRNLRKTSKVTQIVNTSSHSKDIFELTVTEGIVNVSANKHTFVTAKIIDDNEHQLDSSVSLFSVGEVSPVLGKSQCTKSKVIRDTDDNQNKIFGTPRGVGEFTEFPCIDTSPLVGRSSSSHCASTPKVVSKCLLKKFTPGLSVIEEFSPIPRKNTSGLPSNLCSSPTRGNEFSKETAGLSDPQLGHRHRFKSKLSRFAKPEVLELESVAEISPVDKPKFSSTMLLVKESGKNIPKKLQYDAGEKEKQIPHESDEHETHKNKLHEEFNKIKNVESADGCNNDSTFLFKNLNTINSNKTSQAEAPEGKIQQNIASVSYSNISDSVRESHHSSWKPEEENRVESKMNTINTLYGERNQHKDDEMESVKENKKNNEATVNNSPDIIEDCSLFEHITECEVEPPRSSAAEKRDASSLGLSVTQVLHYMNEKCDHDTQHTSVTNSPPKSTQIHSQNAQKNKQSTSQLPAKCSPSLSRNSHHESEVNRTDEYSEVPGTSTTTLARDGSRLSLSKKLPKQPIKCSSIIKWKKTQQDHNKEKHVSFSTLGNEEIDEMSESLLADNDFKLAEMPLDMDNAQSKNVFGNKNSGIIYPLPVENEDQINTKLEDSKNLSTIRLFTSKKQDDGREKSKLMSPTQDESQLLITRKRKVYNVVGSDHEDSLTGSDSEKDISKTSTTSESSRTSTANTCVTAPVRKAIANQMKNQFEDDDDGDFVEVLGPPQPNQKKPKNIMKKKKKRKKHDYLDDEAELSRDCTFVSSDESDGEEQEYDRSFVDDGTYLSQDNAQDMKAVYLRSVVSPVAARGHLNLPPPPKYIHESEGSEDEEEDSFVVDNSFVEYETEYVGDTMLAEDPIIHQALQDRGNTKRTKDAAAGNKAKRKRIILNESTSDEDIAAEDAENKQTPVKVQTISALEKTQPAREVISLGDRSQVRTTALPNRNVPSCSKDNLSEEQDFEIIKEVKSSKSPYEPHKDAFKVLPVSSGSEQRILSNSSRPDSKNSFVHPVTNRRENVVNNQHVPQGFGRSGGNQEKVQSGGYSDGLNKPCTGKGFDDRLDISRNAGTPPSPASSSMDRCHSVLSLSPQLNKSSSSFFVASVPSNSSFTESQSTVSSSPQEAVGVLVDSSEVTSGGNVLSRLRLRYGAHTAVVHLSHAHYAVSTRMAVARLSLAVFSSGQHRSKLVQRVQAMLELYERIVLIVEGEAPKGNQGRSRYLDTIVCACAQVTSLKVLYSKGQEETSHMLWQLLLQEKSKGFKISVVPPVNKKRQQMANFYLTLPNVGYPTALAFSQNFNTVKEFISSSAECIQKKGSISLQRATAMKQYLTRLFRKDMLP